MPVKPLSFDEIKAIAESIDQSFRDAGYVFYHGNTGMTEQSFGENRLYKLDTYGKWQSVAAMSQEQLLSSWVYWFYQRGDLAAEQSVYYRDAYVRSMTR